MATLSYYETPLVVAAGATLSIPANAVAGVSDLTSSPLTLGDGASDLNLPDNFEVTSGKSLTLNVPTLASLTPGDTLTVLPGGTLKLTPGLAATVLPGTIYNLLT